MKTFKYIGLTLVATTMMAASCSDFDDYNTVPTDVTASANKTLWENISANSELSDFAALVKKAGYDDELSAAHYYTVWAPLNGTYDAASLMSEDSAMVLQRFVKCHIAEYNHNVSGPVDERIHTLNQKSFSFMGDGQYTYDGQTITQLNLPSSNGIMHVMSGMATFYPNVYEYLSTGTGIDSLQSYFHHYDISYLDPDRSVLGPMVNGKQTYIDSVMVTYNQMLNRLSVLASSEDSSYTMLMPTNEAWIAAYNHIKPYFHYINTTSAQDIANATSATSAPTVSVTVDAKYLTDSLTRYYIVNNLFFNNNNGYNRWLVDESAENKDTLLSTLHNKLSNPQEILARTSNPEKLSNGFARVADSLAFRSWETWNPTIAFTPTSSYVKVWNGSSYMVNMQITNPELAGLEPGTTNVRFIHVQPTSNYSKPELDVILPNVLSTKYNIYVVTAPGSWDASDTTALRPNQFDFSLSYCNAANKLQTIKLNQKVENDWTKIDTVKVGTFEFPVAYRGLSTDRRYSPNLKITTDFTVFNRPAMAKYTRDFKIISIILRPVEEDEYLSKEK